MRDVVVPPPLALPLIGLASGPLRVCRPLPMTAGSGEYSLLPSSRSSGAAALHCRIAHWRMAGTYLAASKLVSCRYCRCHYCYYCRYC